MVFTHHYPGEESKEKAQLLMELIIYSRFSWSTKHYWSFTVTYSSKDLSRWGLFVKHKHCIAELLTILGD